MRLLLRAPTMQILSQTKQDRRNRTASWGSNPQVFATRSDNARLHVTSPTARNQKRVISHSNNPTYLPRTKGKSGNATAIPRPRNLSPTKCHKKLRLLLSFLLTGRRIWRHTIPPTKCRNFTPLPSDSTTQGTYRSKDKHNKKQKTKLSRETQRRDLDSKKLSTGKLIEGKINETWWSCERNAGTTNSSAPPILRHKTQNRSNKIKQNEQNYRQGSSEKRFDDTRWSSRRKTTEERGPWHAKCAGEKDRANQSNATSRRKERRGERKSRGERESPLGQGQRRKRKEGTRDFFLSDVFPVFSIVSLSCPSVSRSDGQGDESLCAVSHFFPSTNRGRRGSGGPGPHDLLLHNRLTTELLPSPSEAHAWMNDVLPSGWMLFRGIISVVVGWRRFIQAYLSSIQY